MKTVTAKSNNRVSTIEDGIISLIREEYNEVKGVTVILQNSDNLERSFITSVDVSFEDGTNELIEVKVSLDRDNVTEEYVYELTALSNI